MQALILMVLSVPSAQLKEYAQVSRMLGVSVMTKTRVAEATNPK